MNINELLTTNTIIFIIAIFTIIGFALLIFRILLKKHLQEIESILTQTKNDREKLLNEFHNISKTEKEIYLETLAKKEKETSELFVTLNKKHNEDIEQILTNHKEEEAKLLNEFHDTIKTEKEIYLETLAKKEKETSELFVTINKKHDEDIEQIRLRYRDELRQQLDVFYHTLKSYFKEGIGDSINNNFRTLLLPMINKRDSSLESFHTTGDLPATINWGTDLDPIVFSKIDLPVDTAGNILVSSISSILPGSVSAISMMQGAKGLFRATVSPSNLIRYTKDGTYSSMVQGMKGISSHSGFTQANNIGDFTPIAIMQLLSIVTGQYYLNGITKQLNSIAGRIEQLIELHHNEKIALVQSNYLRLIELSKKNVYGLEDLVEIRMIIKDTYSTYKEYTNLVNRINPAAFELVISNNIRARTMINELKTEFDKSNIKLNVDILLQTQKTLLAARLMELKANVSASQASYDRISNMNHLLDNIKKINSDFSQDKENIIKIFKSLKDIAHKIKDDYALTKSSNYDAKELERMYTNQIDEIINEVGEIASDATNAHTELVKKLNEKKDLFFIIDNGGKRHLLNP